MSHGEAAVAWAAQAVAFARDVAARLAALEASYVAVRELERAEVAPDRYAVDAVRRAAVALGELGTATGVVESALADLAPSAPACCPIPTSPGRPS